MTPALRDKYILIVGGTSGLGRSAAEACVAAGAQVVVVGRDQEKCRESAAWLGDRGRALSGDASDPSTAPKAIEMLVRQYGRLDGLYHVAGGSGRRAGDGPLHEITDHGWDYTLRQNLDGLFYSNRAAVQQFLDQGTGGSILNMSSVLAFAPEPEHFATHAYAAAKAAVLGLTRAAAARYAQDGIRLNVICPALVETPMSTRACRDDAIRQLVQHRQPLDGGRVGRAEDLDQAVVYFLSDASRFVTAQVLSVDGGWSVA